ncbi:endoglucanase-4 [Verticillium alfalfae VaMs.102]|uniref:lytic cellulose monooxygenase (C4-dehydrogenating) n=1 Tax=Verticillium alfalfae (strain VaMs.102 / ATCC MYA-4576 / FGSC 10136) TaxID=526221 RepID=C9SVZ8_VERA1|nr:endoglucanase-4 [Verticillium alfalfae VaMs.102]EEY22963.1 endoglucanase-4 [Verticillium alfalfae VaMs.102]
MSSIKSTIALAGAFAATALAHGTVTGFAADGKYEGGYKLSYYYDKINKQPVPEIAAWSAENLDNGFVDGTGYATSDIACHIKSAPGATTASVAAGGKVDFFWSDWPESHFGPVFTYVANCGGDCSAADKATLEWVKIDEAGYNAETKTWAATDLIANNNTWTTTVPATLAAGNYVFRHEIIAMHGAGAVNGAQNYPQCINIAVTGSGTDSPAALRRRQRLQDSWSRPLDRGCLCSRSHDPTTPGGGNGTEPAVPVTPTAPAEEVPSTPVTPIESSAPAPVESSAPAPVATEAPTTPEPTTPEPTTPETPTTPAPTTPDDVLPENFTLKTFIDWLSQYLPEGNARRHARDMMN